MTEFHPYKPEEMIEMKVSRKEAIVIEELRKYRFGKCTIQKLDGLIVRMETTRSKLIE